MGRSPVLASPGPSPARALRHGHYQWLHRHRPAKRRSRCLAGLSLPLAGIILWQSACGITAPARPRPCMVAMHVTAKQPLFQHYDDLIICGAAASSALRMAEPVRLEEPLAGNNVQVCGQRCLEGCTPRPSSLQAARQHATHPPSQHTSAS